MAITIVQQIRNDGPNPGNTQLPQGLATTAPLPLTKGNTVIAWTTCADYGGYHSAQTLTDSEGNVYRKLAILTGSRASLNTSQELVMWAAQNIKGDVGAPATFQQQFVGGDVDYQAFYALELSGVGTIVGADWRSQDAVSVSADAVTSAALIAVAADQLPALLVGFCFNVSELSPVYAAAPGSGMALLANIWPFFEAGGPNVCVAVRQISAAGNYRASFTPPAGVPDYWQTMGVVLSAAAPPAVITLTAQQLAVLTAGGALTLQGPQS